MTQTLLGNVNLFTKSWIKDSSVELNDWKNKERKRHLTSSRLIAANRKAERRLLLSSYNNQNVPVVFSSAQWVKYHSQLSQSFTTQKPVNSNADLTTQPPDKSIGNYKRHVKIYPRCTRSLCQHVLLLLRSHEREMSVMIIRFFWCTCQIIGHDSWLLRRTLTTPSPSTLNGKWGGTSPFNHQR